MVKQNKSLNIAGSQHSGFPRNLNHVVLSIPSQSAFSFGSQSIIDFKVKNIKVHDLTLAFNTSSLTGITANGTYPILNPAYFWFSKLEILINNNVIDTIYPDHQFILSNLYSSDEDRLLNNYSSGSYLSNTSRYTLTNSGGSWYVSLKTLFNQTHMAILSQSHEVQIRITMQNLSNLLTLGGLTGTPSVTINNVQLLARVTQLDANMSQRLLVEQAKIPRHSLFLQTRYQSFVIQSGVSTSTFVLTGIVGSIHSLNFILRPTTGLVGSSAYSYTAIKDFQILDSGGTNINGGAVIPSTFNLTQQQKWWGESTFPAEGFAGTNNSYAYMYSFSVDPASAFKNAQHLTTKLFTGNEQLIINYVSALSGTYQLDVYALVEQAIEQSNGYVKLVNV